MPHGAVVFHVASHAFQAPGGGEIQLVQTGKALEDLGLTVRPFCSWSDRLRDARLLHLFGMSREGLELARIARAQKIPVALSPICWYEPRAIRALASSAPRAAWDLTKWALHSVTPRGVSWRAELIALADAILPNSCAEADQLAGLFGADRRRILITPNGVDARFSESDGGLFRSYYGKGEFVLYVGRIEPRKNVLGLIRSVGSLGLNLVVIGDVVPAHEAYQAACRSAGIGFVRWFSRLEHDDPRLASAHAAARVFALTSWFETPGLAALESALAGCAIVITPFGCTREYFRDDVWYARPSRAAEMARAIAAAWDQGPRPGLAARVAADYSWAEVGRKTREAYDRIAP
jgi:glycosyltransferase involved in cell wall biosynthesis